MNGSFFSSANRSQSRRFSNQHYNTGSSYGSCVTRSSQNFTDNFVDFQVCLLFLLRQKNNFFLIKQPDVHNSTMRLPKKSTSVDMNQHEKPTFSSFFASSLTLNDHQPNRAPDFFASSESLSDGDGIYLQISNLDQYYDEASLRHYLMNQLKPITPILSLTIETPSIAKVKVPSVQVKIIT